MSQAHPSTTITDPEILITIRWNWHSARTLLRLLGPPHEPTQDALVARDQDAFARVAAMIPVNAEEMDLAIHCVAAHDRATEALLQLRAHDGSAEQRARLSAQYFQAERTADAKRALLLRVQAARHRREANPRHCYSDERMMHVAMRQLQQALEEPPPAADLGTVLPEPEAVDTEMLAPEPPASPPPAAPSSARQPLPQWASSPPAAPQPAAPQPAAPQPAAPQPPARPGPLRASNDDGLADDEVADDPEQNRQDGDEDDDELANLDPLDRALLLAMERQERSMAGVLAARGPGDFSAASRRDS